MALGRYVFIPNAYSCLLKGYQSKRENLKVTFGQLLRAEPEDDTFERRLETYERDLGLLRNISHSEIWNLQKDLFVIFHDASCDNRRILELLTNSVSFREHHAFDCFLKAYWKLQRDKANDYLKFYVELFRMHRYDFWGFWHDTQTSEKIHLPSFSRLYSFFIDLCRTQRYVDLTLMLRCGFDMQQEYAELPNLRESVNTPASRLRILMEDFEIHGDHGLEVMLRCLIMTIPESLPTSSQLRAEFYKSQSLWRQYEIEGIKIAMVDRVCDLYERVYPMSAKQFSTPRSLKHFCRCKVREMLHKDWQLPHGIQRLEVPVELKEYLNLEIM